MEKGTKVKHKEYGFEGVVIGEHFFENNVVVKIEKGSNPIAPFKDTYVSNVNNLEVLAAETPEGLEQELDNMFKELHDMIFGTNNDTEDDTEDTFDVELELDGVGIIRFSTVDDLLEFVEKMEKKTK
jgi:hypothetical protein